MLSLNPVPSSSEPVSPESAQVSAESPEESVDSSSGSFAALLEQASDEEKPSTEETQDEGGQPSLPDIVSVGMPITAIIGEVTAQPSLEAPVTEAPASPGNAAALPAQVSPGATSRSVVIPATLAAAADAADNGEPAAKDANSSSAIVATELKSIAGDAKPLMAVAAGKMSDKPDVTPAREAEPLTHIVRTTDHREPQAPGDHANGPVRLPDVLIRQIVAATRGVAVTPTPESIPVDTSRRSEEKGDGPTAVGKSAGIETAVLHRPESVASALQQRVEEHGSANIMRLVQEIRDRVEQTELRQPSEIHLRLEPPELGRVRILLRMDGEQLHGRLLFQHDVARQLFESYLPVLRRQLGDAGIQLGSFDVADHGSRRESAAFPWQEEREVRWRPANVAGTGERAWASAVNPAVGLDVWA